MNAEEQRIAIAKACGWRDIFIQPPGHYGEGEPYGFPPGSVAKAHQTGLASPLPDYLNSLDDMHAAEKMLTEQQQIIFSEMLNMYHPLADLAYPDQNMRGFRKQLFAEAFHLIHATASQRAER
jgi:hypothetical protein